MDDGIEIKAHIYLKKAEIDFSNRGLMAPKARVSTEGEILASGNKINGKFKAHFDLTDEEFEILMKMFNARSLGILSKKEKAFSTSAD